MNIIERNHLDAQPLPGRVIQKAVGRDGFSVSGNMTMGFAHYSESSGPMTPHQHAEEIVLVLNASHGVVRYGNTQDDLVHEIQLRSGAILHIPEMEWHVFDFAPSGFVDIIFFYGQVDDIRPEEKPAVG